MVLIKYNKLKPEDKLLLEGRELSKKIFVCENFLREDFTALNQHVIAVYAGFCYKSS